MVRDGEVARDFEAARLHLVARHPDEPRHLAGMRRDDDVASFAAHQPVRILRERVQPVRVHHERHRRAVDQLPDELARGFRRPESGTDGDHVSRDLEESIDAVRVQAVDGFVERLGHVFRRPGRRRCRGSWPAWQR